MTTGVSEDLLRSVTSSLSSRWDVARQDTKVTISHPDRGTPFHPRHRPFSWEQLHHDLAGSFARQGIAADDPLPLRWGRDTDLTISAIQALDPLLKDRNRNVHRSGYIPQPVVRFTGKRSPTGALEDGWLTSFVNVSCVMPVNSVEEYGNLLNAWISVLSSLGMNARHLSIYGDLSVWTRREVSGITLRFRHLDLTLGDLVLLWNTDDPTYMAVDLGSGLERLAWALTRSEWRTLIFGHLAPRSTSADLDAIRTATLLLGSGITASSRGAGNSTHRILRSLTREAVGLGVSATVREFHQYWSLAGQLRTPWPNITCAIEATPIGAI